MCARLALVLALMLAVGMTRAVAASATATPPPGGSISGVAIDDENGDGVIEPGEPGLDGGWSWEIAIDGTERKAKVAPDGAYRFDGLGPGEHTVMLIAVVGGDIPPWIPTLPGPDLSYEVTLSPGQTLTNINFALQLLDEAAVFTNMGIVVDAAPAPEGTVVQALIGDTVCDEYTVGVGPSSGRQGPIDPPPRQPNDITVAVPSANEKAGCGTEGATITFRVDGQPANETEPWYSGWHAISTLTAGPPSAWFWGNVSGGEVRCSTVTAYVGDTPCSNQFPSMCGSYQVAVFSAELKPGCGTPGSTVRFMIGEAQAEQTAQWSPGRHELNLTTSAASISGMAIEDRNGNGVIDPGEPALAGFKVSIGADETLPAAGGSYHFGGLQPGDYSVHLFWAEGGPPAPWYPTLPGPELSYEIRLGPGENAKDIDFAVQLLPEAAVFGATIMVDAAPAPAGTVVQTLIADTICDESAVGGWSPRSGGLGFATGTPPNTILVVVPSANEKAGCGTEGTTITFRINGQRANETEVWHTSGSGRTTLTTGPPFATYHGTVRLDGTDIHGSDVTGYIGDTPCSTDYGSLLGTYHIIVLPAELKPGCGTPGATVRFMIGEAQAEQTAQWTPGRHDLNLTASAVAPSPTSTAVASPIATPAATASSTPTPSAAPPTPTPSPTRSPAASATSLPSGPGADAGSSSSDDGADWWPFALAAGLVAALSGGSLLVWARRRPRQAR